MVKCLARTTSSVNLTFGVHPAHNSQMQSLLTVRNPVAWHCAFCVAPGTRPMHSSWAWSTFREGQGSCARRHMQSLGRNILCVTESLNASACCVCSSHRCVLLLHTHPGRGRRGAKRRTSSSGAHRAGGELLHKSGSRGGGGGGDGQQQNKRPKTLEERRRHRWALLLGQSRVPPRSATLGRGWAEV